MRDDLEDDEIEERWNPEHEIEDQCAEEFRKDHLPVAHRRGHERLDRAEFKFLREQTHRDQREDQDEGEPEENGVEEGFLHRIRHRLAVHEGELEVEIDAAQEQEENEDDVGNRRIEVTADFAAEESEELAHEVNSLAFSIPVLHIIRMSNLHEDIFQRGLRRESSRTAQRRTIAI